MARSKPAPLLHDVAALEYFLSGKQISSMNIAPPGYPDDDNTFDLVFADGSSVEFYVVENALTWVINPATPTADD